MKLNFTQLDSHLKKTLQPVYCISGDEPFQVDESVRLIREAAKVQGYTEREVYHVDRSFDWDQLSQSAGSMSLFSERKVIEGKNPQGKPWEKRRKAPVAYIAPPAEDKLFLYVSGNLGYNQQKSKMNPSNYS